MTLYNIKGKLVKKPVEKYRINWDKNSRSNIQYATKQFLKPYWIGHVVYEEFPVFGTKLKVDIINFTRKIAIEVQGDQHYKFNKFFHGNRNNFLGSILRDSSKLEWFQLNGITLIEILQDEVDLLSHDFFLSKFNINLP